MAGLILSLGLAFPLHAAIQITGTRVVYPAKEAEVTVKVTNAGQRPTLIQNWIDAGDPNVSATNAKAPFTINPPVARIDPGKSQTLRVSFIQSPLPENRESLFFLNVKEIPPKPDAQQSDWLQLAFRSRLKLFFRPASLHGSVHDALPQLRWQLIRENGAPALRVDNPTPFYVTFAAVELHAGGRRIATQKNTMLSPGEKQTLLLKEESPAESKEHTGPGRQTSVLNVEPSANAVVHFGAINELGGIDEIDSPLKH